MSKPEDYEETCVIVRNVPYQCEEEHFNGMSLTGGVLGKGRIVWVQNFLEAKKRSVSAYSVSVYAEGIGVVSVDPRCLARAKDDRKLTLQLQSRPQLLAQRHRGQCNP